MTSRDKYASTMPKMAHLLPPSDVPQPLYAALRDDLRHRIVARRYAPGERLPSESELCAEHGVSRTTVRQALGDLQKDGLITRLQGKGAFVTPPRASQELRRLEGLAEALAGHGRTVHSVRLAFRRMRAPSAVAQQLGLPAAALATQLVSLRIADGTPLSVSTSFFPVALGDRFARMDLSDRDLIEVLERELLIPVQQARLEIRAHAITTRQARLLKASAGQPALRVDRFLLGQSGQPLQVESATYPADRFSYRLTLTR